MNALSSEDMRCVSVRFGNVLGSNGSVIPIFSQQIAAGGPVTVTHPEMRRYFMTIPEAAQLVLQASIIGKSGETLVLDMGEPVKIVDLAFNLIRLAGLRPKQDIEVRFTGIRPGEKLYEELNLKDESMVPTAHEKIRVFQGAVWDRATMEEQLLRIRAAWEQRDTEQLLRVMKETVPEYNPNRTMIRQPGEGDALLSGADPQFSVTLLGGMERKLDAHLVELSENFVKLRLDAQLSITSALKIEVGDEVLLGEVWSCAREDERYEVAVKVKFRLRWPEAPGKGGVNAGS